MQPNTPHFSKKEEHKQINHSSEQLLKLKENRSLINGESFSTTCTMVPPANNPPPTTK